MDRRRFFKIGVAALVAPSIITNAAEALVKQPGPGLFHFMDQSATMTYQYPSTDELVQFLAEHWIDYHHYESASRHFVLYTTDGRRVA